MTDEIRYSMSMSLSNGVLADTFNTSGLKATQTNSRLVRNVQEIDAGTSPGSGAYASGQFSIPNGVSQVTVTGLALGFTPSTVVASVAKPAGGDNLFATVQQASITDDGFVADLSGTTPATGYILSYYATGSMGSGAAGYALELGGVVAPGLAIFVNLDANNYVEVGVQVSGTFYPFLKLDALQHSGPMFLGTADIYALANTDTVKLFYIIYDR